MWSQGECRPETTRFSSISAWAVAINPDDPGFQGFLGSRARGCRPSRDPSYQLVATAWTIRANPTKSFRSITSAGECEYRSGHPIAASGTP